jgi:hypothetical protein
MRRETATWAVTIIAPFACLSLVGCSDEPEPEPIVNVAGESVVAAQVQPEFGGNVVVAGAYPVEVVAHRSGEVFAYVHVDDPPEGAVLTVDVPVAGRRTPRPLRMRWNEYEVRYEGLIQRLEVEPGPLYVHYEVGGVVYDGGVTAIVVSPAIEVDVEVRPPSPAVRVEVVERRNYKHMRRKHKHMRRKHRSRGGIEIRF